MTHAEETDADERGRAAPAHARFRGALCWRRGAGRGEDRFNLNHWTEPDLRAFYQYVRNLGPIGDPAPEYLPPDKAPPPPFLLWPSPPKK
jgi:hypothetical protein